MNNTPDTDAASQHNNQDRFESDTQKLVRLHLQDKNHVITEDEIRSVRVGMTPPPEEIDSPNLHENGSEKMAGDNTDPAGTPLTPWDAVEP